MSTINGTVKELIDRKLSVNGVALTQPEFALLTRVIAGNGAVKTGSVKTSVGKGKPASVWALDSAVSLNFTADAVTVDATVAPITDDSVAAE